VSGRLPTDPIAHGAPIDGSQRAVPVRGGLAAPREVWGLTNDQLEARRPPPEEVATQCAHANGFKGPLSAAQSAARRDTSTWSCRRSNSAAAVETARRAPATIRERAPATQRLASRGLRPATMYRTRMEKHPAARPTVPVARLVPRRPTIVPPASRRRQDPDACGAIIRGDGGASSGFCGPACPAGRDRAASDSGRRSAPAPTAAAAVRRPTATARSRRELHGRDQTGRRRPRRRGRCARRVRPAAGLPPGIERLKPRGPGTTRSKRGTSRRRAERDGPTKVEFAHGCAEVSPRPGGGRRPAATDHAPVVRASIRVPITAPTPGSNLLSPMPSRGEQNPSTRAPTMADPATVATKPTGRARQQSGPM